MAVGGTVKVRGVNGCGVGSYSNLTVIMNCREENRGIVNMFDVSIYPNPSNNFFTLAVSNDLENTYSIIVHDIIGQTVEQWNNVEGNQAFDFGKNLYNGIYIAEIISGNERKLIRIVKSE